MLFINNVIKKWVREYPELEKIYFDNCVTCEDCNQKFTPVKPFLRKDGFVGFECEGCSCSEPLICYLAITKEAAQEVLRSRRLICKVEENDEN